MNQIGNENENENENESEKRNSNMIITIDGSALSGKSSVAKALMKELNKEREKKKREGKEKEKDESFYYLYTGLLYRGLAYILHRENRPHVERAEDLACLEDMRYYVYLNQEPAVFYKNEDITPFLHTMDQEASILSALPLVRSAFLEVQRRIGQRQNTIADGRDCGSVVFPHAQYKFFLTADENTRTKRFYDNQTRNSAKTKQGADENDSKQVEQEREKKELERIKKEIQERDIRDSTRAIAPLIIPNGAIYVDSSNLTLEETVALFKSHLRL